MKKLLKWLIGAGVVIVVAAVISTGTGKKPTKETKSSEQTSQVTESKKEELFSVGETAVFENIKVTANKSKVSKGTEYFKAGSGNVFVGVNFTVENISNEDISISSILLFDAYVDGTKCDYSFTGNCAFDSAGNTLDGTLPPNKKMTGWYCVEVPKNWAELELYVVQDWLDSSESSARFLVKP